MLVEGRADAVFGGNIFHFEDFTVADVKEFLAGKGDSCPAHPDDLK